MRTFALSRYALTIGAATALLAGCGGSQSPIGARGAVPQGRAVATHAERGGSWMLPEAKREDLIYAALLYYGNVIIYSFPEDQVVGEISGFANARNLCADRQGNVWIMDTGPSYDSTYVYEYAHGSTTRIRTLTDNSGTGWACAVDPSTGDLAVANEYEYDYEANVVVFPNASGSPTEYRTHDVDWPFSATYDDVGDLFVSGQVNVYDAGTDWMPKGATEFKQFKVHPGTRTHVGSEWGDKQLTDMAHPNLIHRFSIANEKATYLGSMTLNLAYVHYFVVHDNYLVASDETNIYIFDFPQGGEPIATIASTYNPHGVAFSVPPK